MILSASRRTDVPCYFSDWFINRVREGYALYRNPMNPNQISKVILSPDIVDCIVFWTKDPLNIMDKLNILDEMGYKYYFQFTLTPYDNSVEKWLRSKSDIEETFISLSKLIGKDRVIWRYDPIILNNIYSIEYHKDQFSRMINKLCRYTENVIVSFVDMYSKNITDLIRPISDCEIEEISRFISYQANEFGITAKACCEKLDLSQVGIQRSSCVDKAILEKICNTQLNLKTDKNQRRGCGCCESIDIGVYNTCLNGCIYCYANYSQESIKNNLLRHNQLGELLIGEVGINEEIKVKKLYSNKVTQIDLFGYI